MNRDKLLNSLLRAARRHPPGSEVPPGFEGRMLARLHAQARSASRTHHAGTDWAAAVRSLWWSAAACAALTIGIGLWPFQPAPDAHSGPDLVLGSPSFADDLEQTILASVSPDELELLSEFEQELEWLSTPGKGTGQPW